MNQVLPAVNLVRHAGIAWTLGLTSNPTIFDHAIKNGEFYDDAIRRRSLAGMSDEALFFELATEDLVQAADLFRQIHDATGDIDGWVSLEVSPLLADDTAGSIKAAARPLGRRPPRCAARRRACTLRPPRCRARVRIASSQDALRNRLGIAIAMQAYKAYRELRASRRWQELAARGAVPQRLLWASTGTKEPTAPDDLYVEALAAPDTINTMPEKTLLAFAVHGDMEGAMPVDGGDAEAVLADFAAAGVGDQRLAADLQREGTAIFARSWNEVMLGIASKRGRP